MVREHIVSRSEIHAAEDYFSHTKEGDAADWIMLEYTEIPPEMNRLRLGDFACFPGEEVEGRLAWYELVDSWSSEKDLGGDIYIRTHSLRFQLIRQAASVK